MDNARVAGLVKLAKAAGRLKRIERTGWAQRFLPHESVADHTYRTAMLTSLICDIFDLPVDHAKAVKMALVHDLGEAFIGDWEASSTKVLGKSLKHEIEGKAVENILSALQPDRAARYMELWRECADSKTLEARLVKLADKLDALIQAKEMEEAGVCVNVYEDFKNEISPEVFGVELSGVYSAILKSLVDSD
ncbi:MAG: HD domain-containing protein [Thermoprotei archaeon]